MAAQQQVKRVALLMAALSVVAVALVACQAPTAPVQASNSTGVTGFRTPIPGGGSPTPTFPPFTMGAWPSNYSPANNDNLTIYVLLRVQVASMDKPSYPPPAGITVTISLAGPISGTYSAQSDSAGLAAIPIQLNDPFSGQPVTVVATSNYNGQTYTAYTFFTPNPTARPTATPNATATPGAGATPTSTPGDTSGG